MFCSNCGTQINNPAAFCSNCGAPVTQQVQEPITEAVVVQQETQTDFPVNPVVCAIKKASASNFVLFGNICTTVSIIGILGFYFIYSLFSIASVFFTKAYSYSIFLGIAMLLATSMSAISGAIPLIGTWQIHLAGKKNDVAEMNTKGFNTVKIGIFIQLIMLVLSIFLEFFFSFLIGASFFASRITALYTIVFFLCLIFTIPFIVASIIYYLQTIKTLTDIRDSAQSGQVCGKISTAYIVILFIFAATSFSSFFWSFTAAYILYAIALIKLKKELACLSVTQ